MKIVLLFISLGILVACTPSPFLSLKSNTQKQIIALQPLDNYDESYLTDLALDIRDFYDRQTIILKSIAIPYHFNDTMLGQYSADSLIMFLSALRNDSIAAVIGFTRDPIYTIKKNGLIPYYEENIFGLGHQPGNVCIVSDSKFCSTYRSLCYRRLRKVTIHEIGHNLGLSHCEDEKCIMSEKNGNTITLDKNGDNYCQKCRNIVFQ